MSLLTAPFVYNGIAIIESPHALVATEAPVREHARKPWMTGRVYHARVQKKWIKRFGYVMKPAMFKTPAGIIAHPRVAAELRRAIARQER